jgi:hypothetical protein
VLVDEGSPPVRYVMLITGVEPEWNAATPEENEAAMRAVFAWFDRRAAADTTR